jgi:NADH dehydrogenase
MKVILVEGSAHTLNNMNDLAKVSSEKYLNQMGVEIITQTFVKDYDGKNAVLSNGKTLETSTLIWAAGVSGNILPGLVNEAYLPNSRYKVDSFNAVHNHNDI